MDLRTFTLIALGLGATGAHAAVRAYPLDERTVYTVRLSRGAPTTCVFPGAPTALEGAGISAQTEDGAAVLLSHQPGADYFSVRALRDEAAGALNVIFRGKVYVLSFVTGGAPDRVVRFLDEPLAGAGPTPQAPPIDVLARLGARARQASRLVAQFPGLTSTVERSAPGTVTHYPQFSVTVAEVFRFEAEDTLVLHVRFTNPSPAAVAYDATQLAVRVGAEIYPAAWVDASGAIPPEGQADAWIAVSGAPGGGRSNLSVHERFSVIAPRP